MLTDFDHIRREAHAYAIECNAADRPVSLQELCRRLGVNPQWLSSGMRPTNAKARAIVLRQWADLKVQARGPLVHSIAEYAGHARDTPEWAISEDEWPHHTELTRILALPGRREMFTHLRNTYGRETAMRYAHVCDNPPAKGADRNCAQARGGAHAVV